MIGIVVALPLMGAGVLCCWQAWARHSRALFCGVVALLIAATIAWCIAYGLRGSRIG